MEPRNERPMVLVGAGPVGIAAARSALQDGAATGVTAVVDPDDGARAAACSEFSAIGHTGIHELGPAPHGTALVAFSSRASAVAAAASELTARGFHVVTTCEELAYPEHELRVALSDTCRRLERSIVVTGANPGFVMDRLPVFLSTGCRGIRQVRVVRRVDTRTRRAPLVAKSGYGLSRDEFAAGVADGRVGHVGLEASGASIAEVLGWKAVLTEYSIAPVTANGDDVIGQHQVARFDDEQGRSIVLDLTMAWGLETPGDTVEIDGAVGLRATIEGGFPGDEGTGARVSTAVRGIRLLDPDFYRPVDLPLSL